MDVAEFLRKVAVAAFVHNMKPGNERNIGNGKVHAAVGDACFLKALDLHLCVRVEQRQDAAGGIVNLHGVNITALADVSRH